MSLFFEKNNISSATAENGRDGLQMFCSDPLGYDAIFMDLQMPVMDGYETTKHIRESGAENAKTVPIIAMSGTNWCITPGRDGFDYFMRKPFKMADLMGVLEDMLCKKAGDDRI